MHFQYYLCLCVLFILFNPIVVLRTDEHNSSSDDDDDDYHDSSDSTDCASGDCDKVSGDSCNSNDIIDRLKEIYDEGVNETVAVRDQNFNQTVDRFDHIVNVVQRLFAPYRSTGAEIFELLSTADLSDQCFSSIVASYRAAQRNEIWPLKFIDSTAFPQTSLFTFEGFSNFGDYDQCLDITSTPLGDNKIVITGQYCMVKVKLPYPPIESFREGDPLPKAFQSLLRYMHPFNIRNFGSVTKFIEGLNIANGTIYRNGICIPSTCTAQEIENAFNKAFYPITHLPIEVGPECEVKARETVLDNYQLVSALILLILVFLVILSTGVEIALKMSKNCYTYSTENLLKQDDNPPLINLLLSFSLVRNTSNLFRSNTKKEFTALETIKLIVIINAITAHFHLFTPILASPTLKKIRWSIPIQIQHSGKYFFVRNPIILDALFSMSGFIMSYGLARKLDKNGGKFSYIGFVLLRWLRFILPIFGTFLFFFLIPFTGDGPMWQFGMNYFMSGCKSNKNFLTSFFLVNNFVDMIDLKQGVVNQCNPPIWFASAIFHLHVIAPLLAILYYKRPKLGFYANIVLIVIGLFAAISPQLLFGIKPYSQHLLIPTFEEVNHSFTWYHTATVQWITSFFVGTLFGYGLKINYKISSMSSGLWWLTTAFVIFVNYVWNNNLWRLEPTVTDLNVLGFYSIGKLLASVAFCWIYFACCSGRGGFINKMLSWSGFRALSNLSFSMFMIHTLIIIHRIFTVKETVTMDDAYMARNFVLDFILCVGLGYVFYALIECPIANLIAICFKSKTEQQNNIDNNNIDNKLKEEIVLQLHKPVAVTY